VSAEAARTAAGKSSKWPSDIYRVLKAADVRQMAYVPDAGHTTLINLFSADPDVICNVLTTEEEGIAIAAGAWLGGQRSVLLLQSSGVGNCINMLSLPVIGRFPLLMLVTMRGEWAEFNPWQVPMGRGTQGAWKRSACASCAATPPPTWSKRSRRPPPLPTTPTSRSRC